MTDRRGRKRHSPEQIIAKLREADAMLGSGASIGQVCQKLEVSEPTGSEKGTFRIGKGDIHIFASRKCECPLF